MAAIRLVQISILAALLISISMNLSGCSQAQNLPSSSTVNVGPCPMGVGGMNADCCDSTGAILSPPPSSDPSCTVAVPGVGGVLNPMNAGSASAGSSLGENARAESLANGNGAMGTLGQASAATAAPNAASLGSNGGSLGGTPLNNALSGNASNGSGSGGSGTGTGTDSSVATAPAAVALAPKANLNPDLHSGTVATYSAAGSGGGLLPNGAHETGFHYGNGMSGVVGVSTGDSEIGFGGQRNPASSTSADPDDYFTRIELQDSLFKKVEKRYRATSANWATAAQ